MRGPKVVPPYGSDPPAAVEPDLIILDLSFAKENYPRVSGFPTSAGFIILSITIQGMARF